VIMGKRLHSPTINAMMAAVTPCGWGGDKGWAKETRKDDDGRGQRREKNNRGKDEDGLELKEASETSGQSRGREDKPEVVG